MGIYFLSWPLCSGKICLRLGCSLHWTGETILFSTPGSHRTLLSIFHGDSVWICDLPPLQRQRHPGEKPNECRLRDDGLDRLQYRFQPVFSSTHLPPLAHPLLQAQTEEDSSKSSERGINSLRCDRKGAHSVWSKRHLSGASKYFNPSSGTRHDHGWPPSLKLNHYSYKFNKQIERHQINDFIRFELICLSRIS